MNQPRRRAARMTLGLYVCLAVAAACSQGDRSLDVASTTTSTETAVETPAETPATTPAPTPVAGNLVPVIVNSFPHDETSWTQGLEWHEGQLLESTGRYEQSSLRFIDVETGLPTELLKLNDDLYAEGVTVVDGRALQITWQDEALVSTELADLSSQTSTVRANAYDGEGWGLCFNGVDLVMSDGSNRLTFRDPDTFEARQVVEVELNGAPLEDLNELECVGGQIWANVWQTPTIVVINPDTGAVEASVNAQSLIPEGYADVTDAVLNGIAYNPERQTFWLTGKLWPVLYEVTFAPA